MPDNPSGEKNKKYKNAKIIQATLPCIIMIIMSSRDVFFYTFISMIEIFLEIFKGPYEFKKINFL